MIFEEFSLIEVKEKIGMLKPDRWLVNSYCESKDYYRVQLAYSDTYRPIGIIDRNELEQAIDENKAEFVGMLKLKDRPKKEKQ